VEPAIKKYQPLGQFSTSNENNCWLELPVKTSLPKASAIVNSNGGEIETEIFMKLLAGLGNAKFVGSLFSKD
jgi:hypothetical protein